MNMIQSGRAGFGASLEGMVRSLEYEYTLFPRLYMDV